MSSGGVVSRTWYPADRAADSIAWQMVAITVSASRGITTPMVSDRRVRSDEASRFGRYPSSSAAAITRCAEALHPRVGSVWRRTRDAVETCTPARSAIACSVASPRRPGWSRSTGPSSVVPMSRS